MKRDLKVMKTCIWKESELKVGVSGNGSLSRPKLIKSCSTDRIGIRSQLHRRMCVVVAVVGA